MKRILITGKSSFLGTSLDRYLSCRYLDDYKVHAISVRGDDWGSFDGYDVLFHAAGVAHTDGIEKEEYQKVNSDLALCVAERAKEAGISQFIFMSTSLVYGEKFDGNIITKDTTPTPNTYYGISKLDAEIKLKALEDEYFKICIIRSPMVYGEGCKGNYRKLRNLAVRTPIFPKLNNQRSMIYVENLMEFIRLVIDREEEGVFWVQNEEYVNTSELVREIAAAHGRRVILVPGFNGAIGLAGRFSRTIRKASSSLVYDKKISSYDFDYNICSFAESIRRTEK